MKTYKQEWEDRLKNNYSEFTHLKSENEKLRAVVKVAVDRLKTLKVAVNDIQPDLGATCFIHGVLTRIETLMSEVNKGEQE